MHSKSSGLAVSMPLRWLASAVSITKVTALISLPRQEAGPVLEEYWGSDDVGIAHMRLQHEQAYKTGQALEYTAFYPILQ